MDPRPDDDEVASRPRKSRRKSPADPGIVGGNHKFKIESRESHQEIAARLSIEKAKVDHDLRKDFAFFLVVIGIVILATVSCLFIVLSNRYSVAIQNAAMALLAVIVSGGVGYATGKSSR